MSHELISRNADLKRLQEEGYEVRVVEGYLLLCNVPYVNAKQGVRLGTLVSNLELQGDITSKPQQHVAHFTGEHPCHADGRKFSEIEHRSSTETLAAGIVVNHSFSSKPAGGYKDYHEKMTTYANMISAEAQLIDSTATPNIYPPSSYTAAQSPFKYPDTASSRAGIVALHEPFRTQRVAVVGVGGTGSYVADLLAKTPIAELHLFDGDDLLNHNAFRSPGAASLKELRTRPNKAEYYARKYSRMKNKVVAHPNFLTEQNCGELKAMTFVFLCIDRPSAKEPIIRYLMQHGIAFVDVGMGIELSDGSLGGILRSTLVTADHQGHVANRISVADRAEDDAYSQNIQVVELNALNATMAVIRWKRLLGFYRDTENEFTSCYTVDGNHFANSDHNED